MLAPVGELTFGEPELLELTLAAAELYPELRRRAGGGDAGSRPATRGCGALHVALDRDEAAQLRRVHDLQRALGLDAEWLPPRALPRARARPDARRSTAASTRRARRRSTRGRLTAALLAALEARGGRGADRGRGRRGA